MYNIVLTVKGDKNLRWRTKPKFLKQRKSLRQQNNSITNKKHFFSTSYKTHFEYVTLDVENQ